MGRLPFDLDIEEIAELAAIIKENDLEEIRFEDNDCGEKLVLKGKRHCSPKELPPMPMPMMMPAVSTNVASAPSSPAAAETAAPVQTSTAKGNEVTAPIVGTFYASPSPEKPPFVTVGQRVKKGDILMIIESMKIMNEVPSPFDGEVKEILVKSGDAVEFDQPVMIIG